MAAHFFQISCIAFANKLFGFQVLQLHKGFSRLHQLIGMIDNHSTNGNINLGVGFCLAAYLKQTFLGCMEF